MVLTQTHLIHPQWELISTPSFSFQVVGDLNQNWTLKKRIVRVGTHTDNDVVIEGVGISRFHFKIEADPSGHRLIDLESKNGVHLNGIRVKEAYLRDGLCIQIGSVQLQHS